MIDLSQAISLEPEREQVRLNAPFKKSSSYEQERPAKGKVRIAMAWFALLSGLVGAGIGVIFILGAKGLIHFPDGEVSWEYAIVMNLMILPFGQVLFWAAGVELEIT